MSFANDWWKNPEHCGSSLLLGFDNPLLRALIVGGRPTALGAQAGEARLASVFKKAGFGQFRRTK